MNRRYFSNYRALTLPNYSSLLRPKVVLEIKKDEITIMEKVSKELVAAFLLG